MMQAVGRKIVIKQDLSERIEDGIYIPKHNKAFTLVNGEVVSIGTEVPKNFVKIGDIVKFDESSIYFWPTAENPYVVVNYENVIGVVD